MEGRSGTAAILFLMGGMYSLDVYSAVNSSPWTAHNFAGSDESVEALMFYIAHAVILTLFFTAAASLIDGTWWPLIGGIIGGSYMFWLYMNAIDKGQAAGKHGWNT